MSDIWDVKAIDAQIDSLKGSLNSLKGALSSAQGSYCTGNVSCNTAQMLIAIASAHITVVENEIKLLTQIKQRIKFAVPNSDFFGVDKEP